MPYDLEGARKAGGTDSQIAEYLAGQNNYDLDAARKAGGSDSQIVEYLASIDKTPPKQVAAPTVEPATVETAAPEKKLTLPQYSRPIEATRMGLRGLTIGASDVLGAGVATGAAMLTGANRGQPAGEVYRDIKTDISGSRDQYRADHPVEAAAAEIGGAIAPAILTAGASTPAATGSLLGSAVKGGVLGATQGAVYGGSQADVGKETEGAIQGAEVGGAVGAALPVAGRLIKTAIAPATGQNPQLQTLMEKGVRPTIGQAMGGVANDLEQKLTSVPFAGKKIADARYGAVKDFNNAVINEALAPIGAKVEGSGFGALKGAKMQVKDAYNNALSKIDGVKFDEQFGSNLQQLRGMAENLSGGFDKRFSNLIDKEVGTRMSEAGGMLPETYKTLDSQLGKVASDYAKSGSATEREFGQAVMQLQQLLKDQMHRSNPQVANELQSADAAFARLVRVQQAAKAAKNNEGIFSPAQFNAAVSASDKSARKNAVSSGEALMQDIGRAGQSVLANTVPDSGTMGRLAAGSALLGGGGVGGALAGSASLPAVATAGAGIAGLRGLYSEPVQNALVKLATRGSNSSSAADMANMLISDRARQAVVIAANSGGNQ